MKKQDNNHNIFFYYRTLWEMLKSLFLVNTNMIAPTHCTYMVIGQCLKKLTCLSDRMATTAGLRFSKGSYGKLNDSHFYKHGWAHTVCEWLLGGHLQWSLGGHLRSWLFFKWIRNTRWLGTRDLVFKTKKSIAIL